MELTMGCIGRLAIMGLKSLGKKKCKINLLTGLCCCFLHPLMDIIFSCDIRYFIGSTAKMIMLTYFSDHNLFVCQTIKSKQIIFISTKRKEKSKENSGSSKLSHIYFSFRYFIYFLTSRSSL